MVQTTMRGLVGALLCALALVACGSEERESAPSGEHVAATGEGATGEGAGEPAGGGPAAGGGCGDPAQAAAVAEDPSFELRATASGPYAPGQEGRFDIALTPRGEYHVNTQYPMTIRVQGTDEVTFPAAELGPDRAAEIVEPRARFQVPFTARSAGEHRVVAEVDFAVCTPESCMPDCRTLAVVLPVTGEAPAPEGATATP